MPLVDGAVSGIYFNYNRAIKKAPIPKCYRLIFSTPWYELNINFIFPDNSKHILFEFSNVFIVTHKCMGNVLIYLLSNKCYYDL
jgi:hypothetical protein